MSALRAERDENACRKDFLPSEAVACAGQIEAAVAAAAKERMTAGKKQPSSNLDEGPAERRTDTQVAKSADDRTSLAKARGVVAAAKERQDTRTDLQPSAKLAEGSAGAASGRAKPAAPPSPRRLPTRCRRCGPNENTCRKDFLPSEAVASDVRSSADFATLGIRAVRLATCVQVGHMSGFEVRSGGLPLLGGAATSRRGAAQRRR